MSNSDKETQGESPREVATDTPQEEANAETGLRGCEGLKPDGTPCSVAPLSGSNFCFFHAPGKHAMRREAQALGGRQNRMKTLGEDVPEVEIGDREDMARLLVETINQVRTGRIDPRIATTVAYLGNMLMSIVKENELEKRIQQLEAITQPGRGRR